MSNKNTNIPDNIKEIILKGKLSQETISEHKIGPEHFMSMLDIDPGEKITNSQLKQMLKTPHIIMESAAFAGVTNTASENYHAKTFLNTTGRKPNPKDNIIYTPEADLNMRALAAVYRHNGHHVTILPPEVGLIDQHYSTDSNKNFQTVEDTGEFEERDGKQEKRWRFKKAVSLTPNFTHESRQPEADHKERFLRSGKNTFKTIGSYIKNGEKNIFESKSRILIKMQNKMEFGDTRIAFHKTDGAETGFVLAGIAAKETMKVGDKEEEIIGRSSKEGHEEFEHYLNEYVDKDIKVETIELKQPYYHMDTTGVIANGYFFTNPAAYSEKSWERLQELFGDKLITIPEIDIGEAFGGNGTSFDGKIYISDKISMETAGLMSDKGFDVYLTPIPWTIASGGGHRCMTSVDHIYMPGGYELDNDIAKTLHEAKQKKGEIFKIEIDYTPNKKSEQIILNKYVPYVPLGNEKTANIDKIEKYPNRPENWKLEEDLTNIVPEYSDLYPKEMERHGLSV